LIFEKREFIQNGLAMVYFARAQGKHASGMSDGKAWANLGIKFIEIGAAVFCI
jgi:hypothetical protein